MKKLTLTCLMLAVILAVKAQSLVSMSPNTMVQGSPTIVSTITGAGTLFQNGSPPNSIVDVTLSGPATYNLWAGWWGGGNLTVTDDEHADVGVTLPVNAPVGSYTLSVTYYDCCPGSSTPITLTLPNAFTVIAPDGYAQGTMYWDLNQNGVQDAGENGIPSTQGIINPGTKVFTTDASGNYSYPLTNGNYTVTFSNVTWNDYLFLTTGAPDTISFVINNANSSGNNFPLYRGLTSVYPDSGWIGQNFYMNIYSDKGIFRPGNVTIGSARLKKISSSYSVVNSQYTYIDTNHAVLRFNIPNNSLYLGSYNLEVTTTSPYNGKHILPACVEIVPPPILLSGIVFLDSDSDGVKDPSEIGLANKSLLLLPDSSYAFSDLNGNYFLGTDAGTKTISVLLNGVFYLAPNNVSSYTATVNTSTPGFNFGLLSNNGNYNCQITNFHGTRRCNISNSWHSHTKNHGNNAIDGWVYVVKSSNVSFGNAIPITTYINGDTAAWNFTGLLPFQNQVHKIDLLLPGAGTQFTAHTIIKALDGSGNIQCSKSSGSTYTVTCAWDPNDKAATPEGVYAQHYTLMSDTLSYLIRFQNTGNDTAFTVVIRDTIDQDLDLSTFEVLTSSHTMNTELNVGTRIAKFTFNNILLPDSNVNEPGSHGFISYTIKAKTGLPNNTLVTNDADIYFDFNPPVITNETFNTMVYVIPVGISEIENNLFNAIVIPNPFENFAMLKFDNEQHDAFTLNIYSIDGKLIESILTTENTIALKKEKMTSGLYLFELENKRNSKTTRGKFAVK